MVAWDLVGPCRILEVAMVAPAILRRPEVEALTKLSRSTIYGC